jgi:hypothetical protein
MIFILGDELMDHDEHASSRYKKQPNEIDLAHKAWLESPAQFNLIQYLKLFGSMDGAPPYCDGSYFHD